MRYVGARYMPKFMGYYDATTEYEALSVVDNGMGTSYVSNKPVPAGTPLSNNEYWEVYGASSGAIINLQNQIDTINAKLPEIDYNKHFYNIEAFGGKGDGVTDNLAAFNAAILAMSEHDTLYFPKGTYIFSGGVTINKSIELCGDGCNGVSTNPNWSGTGSTTLQFNNSTGDCIVIKRTGYYICGLHIHDMVIRGSNLDTDNVISLWNGSTCIFERLQIRNYDQAGIALYAESDMLTSFTNINNCSFVYGVHSSVKGGAALLLDGGSTDGVTQSYIENISSLSSGHSIIIRHSDNNVFTKCYGYSANEKTLLLDVKARMNYFSYFTGSIDAKDGSVGNIFEHYISEGGSVDIESGAVMAYNVQDYITGAEFVRDMYYETKTKYFAASEMLKSSGTNNWSPDISWNIPGYYTSDASGKLGHSFTDKNMHTGKLKNLRIYFTATSANAELEINVTIFSTAVGSQLVTTIYNDNVTLTDDSYAKVRYLDIPLDGTFTKGNIVHTIIESVNAVAGKIGIVGFEYDYMTTQPDSNFEYSPLS